MGQADDKMAVLDEKLQVRGVKGLRVADCSVMPTLHGGHTQMPAYERSLLVWDLASADRVCRYGIGEKAADLVKQSWTKAS